MLQVLGLGTELPPVLFYIWMLAGAAEAVSVVILVVYSAH